MPDNLSLQLFVVTPIMALDKAFIDCKNFKIVYIERNERQKKNMHVLAGKIAELKKEIIGEFSITRADMMLGKISNLNVPSYIELLIPLLGDNSK